MRRLFIAALAVGIAGSALAYGPHDPNCVECHSIHKAKGQAILAVAPNTKQKNPATGAGVSGGAALCLGCHNDEQGIMPIHLAATHPVGMKPNKVKVPAELLEKDGSLGCASCHDPHPANPGHKYLRGSVSKGSELGKFCALCHPEKADMGAFAKSAAPAAPAAAAPVKK
ncbi:MAG: cytochrome c3 family protein [Deferrisomatales bacterium]